MIKYHKMSLFDAPLGSALLHAVNCKGNFGTGVAKQIGDKFPEVYTVYKERLEWAGKRMLGGISYTRSSDRYEFLICNIHTSVGESFEHDPVDEILINTTTALYEALEKFASYTEFYLPKINSGGFEVPWEKTVKILEVLGDRYQVTFNVCDPNLIVDNKES